MRRGVRVARALRTTAVTLVAVLALGAAAIQASGHGYIWHALSATYLKGHATAHIDDAADFAQRTIPTGTPVPWPRDARHNRDPLDGRDAAGLVLRRGFEREPGSAFEYSSGSTQLLGVFLQRALAAREPGLSIAEHLSRSLWKPLGMARDAVYTLDREGGIERTYCCVFATARDFARLGQLLLQDGEWNGRPLLDRAFVERMRTPDLVPHYGHSLWMDLKYTHPFWFMQGHQGQYVIGVPSKRLVIVRTGRFRDKDTKGPDGRTPAEVYRFVDQAVALSRR